MEQPQRNLTPLAGTNEPPGTSTGDAGQGPPLEETLTLSSSIEDSKNETQEPALIEMVLGELGRVDLFDADSLKALRLVSKTFRDVVDDTSFFTSVKFRTYDIGGLAGLEQWCRSSSWMRRTYSVKIEGVMPPELAHRLYGAIFAQRPPIKRLKLVDVGEAAGTLLSAPLDTLRGLTLKGLEIDNNTTHILFINRLLSGLRSLFLSHCRVAAASMARVLASFSDLQTLDLVGLTIKREYAKPDILQTALQKLELLRIHGCRGINKLGLVGSLGPSLPSLRSVELRTPDLTLGERPWLPQLTSLILNADLVVSPGVSAALNGGALQELELLVADEVDAYFHWNWDLELPHLTRLHLWSGPDAAGDVLGDAARARLPALRTVKLAFDMAAVSGARAFAAAFPQLRELTLYRCWGDEIEGVMQVFFSYLVPNLEFLTINVADDYLDSTLRAVTQCFYSTAPAPLWPRLRSLELRLLGYDDENYLDEAELFSALASAAPHMPGLKSLCIWAGEDTEAAVAAMAAAATKFNALNLLSVLHGNPRFLDEDEW